MYTLATQLNAGLMEDRKDLFTNENVAADYIQALRSPDGPVCPYCGLVNEVYKLKTGRASQRAFEGVWKCKGCRKQFTIRINSIFHRSHVPLTKWLAAIHLMCSRPVTATDLYRSLDLGSYRTALFLMHRLRIAVRQLPQSHFQRTEQMALQKSETAIYIPMPFEEALKVLVRLRRHSGIR
jgi:transposase-like protein